MFDPVTREQAGDYVCAAENSVGRSSEAVTTVEVLCEYKHILLYIVTSTFIVTSLKGYAKATKFTFTPLEMRCLIDSQGRRIR